TSTRQHDKEPWCASASVWFFRCHFMLYSFTARRCTLSTATGPTCKHWLVRERSRTRGPTTRQPNTIKLSFASSPHRTRRAGVWAETWQESAVARKRRAPSNLSPDLANIKAREKR